MNMSYPKMSASQLSGMNSQCSDLSPIQSQKYMNQQHNENFKVAVRVRPPLQREVMDGRFISTVGMHMF